MIIGSKSKFAIESVITKAYKRLSFRALGYFVIYIKGTKYGIDLPNATLLACSFDEVENRLLGRGSHKAFFDKEPDANKIADAVCSSIYSEEQKGNYFFSIPCANFYDIIVTNKLMWAPDGDQAFDDGSHILQFDIEDQVRLIGFKRYENVVNNLTDIWLDASVFYTILQRWHDTFKSEWKAALKISEHDKNS
jgi:hypothetical protein